jgi:FKBP-type peptidyl-prolyl cis-trans isomerase FkpA
MQVVKQVVGAISFAALLASCNSIDFQKTKSGVPYKVYADKAGRQIADGDIVKFQVIQKLKDSVLFNSYNQGMPQYVRLQANAPMPANYNNIQANILEIMPKLKTGDSVYFAQSADSFIKQSPDIVKQINIKKGDQIVTTIRIVNAFKNVADAQQDQDKESFKAFSHNPQIQTQMSKDDQAIQQYLSANHISAQKTDWGTYVQVITPGKGPKPANGKFVSLRYKGAGMDGQEFDSNEKPGAPLLPLQIGAGGSIKGFEDGVKQLSKGAKARIFIPSMLGYGPQGNPPRIQPNENLIFDVEVVDITDAPPAQQPSVQPQVDTSRAKK